MSLTLNDKIKILPLFIRRDLGAVADAIGSAPNLTRPQKIEVLTALTRIAADSDDPAGIEIVLKVLGI
jgi:hypothetical protein